MRLIIPEVESYDLYSNYLNTTWLRIQLDGRVLFRQCHAYLASADNNVDLFRINSAKLERFAYFNGVSSVEEVNGPPAVTLPTPEPPAVEHVKTPAAPTPDDDIAF